MAVLNLGRIAIISNEARELALRACSEILEHLLRSSREEIRPMLRRQWVSDGAAEQIFTGTIQELSVRHKAFFAILDALYDIDTALARAGAPRLEEWDQPLADAVFASLRDTRAYGSSFALSTQGAAATILRKADEATLCDCGVRAETAQAIIARIGDGW